MMDIVEALRQHAQSEAQVGSCYPQPGLTGAAASVIEKLREKVQTLRDAAEDYINNCWCEEDELCENCTAMEHALIATMYYL